MSEPRSFISGNSVSWTRYLPDYPAGIYTLTYAFRKLDGGGAPITFDAVADGVASHKLTLTPAQSLTVEAGMYSLVGYVTDDETGGAVTKETVFDGTVQVLPNPLTSQSADRRTHVRKMVDLLRAALEKLAAGTTTSVSVQGKTWNLRSLAELRAELARYEELLRQEEAASRASSGAGNIYVRFGNTGF